MAGAPTHAETRATHMDRGELEVAFDRLLRRVTATLAETGPAFPLYAEPGGRWVTTVDGNWCAGHWIALLWIAARHAGSEAAAETCRDAACAHLDTMLRLQHLRSLFAGMNHFYGGFLGYDATGEARLRDVGLAGAEAMVKLFNAKARQIPIGAFETFGIRKSTRARPGFPPPDRRHVAAVDAIHTSLPVLWRAHAETGDAPFSAVAHAHAGRHLDWHLRPDGSVIQKTVFDPETGAPVRSFSSLAFTDDGCWSRGLGWNVAGLADTFRWTGDLRYLAALDRSVAFYLRHAGESLVPAWDLTHPDPAAKRDTSAAALVACGLLLACATAADRRGDRWRTGLAILSAILRDHQRTEGAAAGGILRGCYAHPSDIAIDNELIWTDFYVAAALEMALAPPAESPTGAASRSTVAMKTFQ